MSAIWAELKTRLTYVERPFPADAVALASTHRDEVAPYLVAAIEAIAEDPAPALDGNYMLHLFAMHLLALWRDTRAYPALVRWGHFPQDRLDHLLGDALHESYGRCLASVCNGDTAPIKALAEDIDASIWARWSALTALTTRVLEGDDRRESLVDYLIRLGTFDASRIRLEGHDDEFDLLNAIISCACDIGAKEMLPVIRNWYAEKLVDEQHADLPWIEQDIVRPFETHREDTCRHNDGYIVDVAREMAWMGAYRDIDESEYPESHLEPYVRSAPKVGRNDLCPCGSGKKYKKCCGAS